MDINLIAALSVFTVTHVTASIILAVILLTAALTTARALRKNRSQ